MTIAMRKNVRSKHSVSKLPLTFLFLLVFGSAFEKAEYSAFTFLFLSASKLHLRLTSHQNNTKHIQLLLTLLQHVEMVITVCRGRGMWINKSRCYPTVWTEVTGIVTEHKTGHQLFHFCRHKFAQYRYRAGPEKRSKSIWANQEQTYKNRRLPACGFPITFVQGRGLKTESSWKCDHFWIQSLPETASHNLGGLTHLVLPYSVQLLSAELQNLSWQTDPISLSAKTPNLWDSYWIWSLTT